MRIYTGSNETQDLIALDMPNMDYGYETTIQMPFKVSKIANGTVAVVETGRHIRYTCKGSCVMEHEGQRDFFRGVFMEWLRGQHVRLTDCNETGFFPFSPYLLGGDWSPSDGYYYSVILNNIKLRGAIDHSVGRGFRLDMEMLHTGSGLPDYDFRQGRPEGAMTIENRTIIGDNGVRVDGIRFPPNGFSPELEHNLFVRQMKVGEESVSYRFDRQTNPITITANKQTALGIIRAIVLYIRYDKFVIWSPLSYRISSHTLGTTVDGKYMYLVRLGDNEIKVKHVRFDEFEITFNVTNATAV